MQSTLLKQKKGWAKRWAPALVPLACGALLCGLIQSKFYSFGAFSKYLSGQRCFLLNEGQEMKVAALDGPTIVEASILNLDSKPTKIIGCTVSCGCMSPEKLPIVIQPGQKKQFQISIKPKRITEDQFFDAKIFTDQPKNKTLNFSIKAVGLANGEPAK